MRKLSRAFLLISGILCIAIIFIVIGSLVVSWISLIANVALNMTILGLTLNSGDPEVIRVLMSFAQYTSWFKITLSILGFFGDETMTTSATVTYLTVDSIFSTISVILSTISVIVPLIISLIAGILALKGSGKKAGRGIHTTNIVFGALAMTQVYQIFGILMILGGVFGTIVDGKEESAKEKEEKKTIVVSEPLPMIEEYK